MHKVYKRFTSKYMISKIIHFWKVFILICSQVFQIHISLKIFVFINLWFVKCPKASDIVILRHNAFSFSNQNCIPVLQSGVHKLRGRLPFCIHIQQWKYQLINDIKYKMRLKSCAIAIKC